MHDLRKIAVAEPWGTDRNLGRQNEYSSIWKSEPYMLDACLEKKWEINPEHLVGNIFQGIEFVAGNVTWFRKPLE